MPLCRVLTVGIGPEEEQGGQPIARLTAPGLVDESGDLASVEALVLEELRPHEQVRVSQRGGLMVRDLSFATAGGRHDPDVAGHRRVGVVVDDLFSRGMPHMIAASLAGCRGAATDAAFFGQLDSLASLGGNLEDVVLVVEILREGQRLPVGRPAGLALLHVLGQEHT